MDRPYGIESENGKHFLTTQYVHAMHGKAEKNWPFITCSDSPFTEVCRLDIYWLYDTDEIQAEWNRYKRTCQEDGVPLPTKPRLAAKIVDINNLINRPWTEDELQEKLTKSGVLVNKFNPILRLRLNNQLKEAKARGDTDSEEKYRKELEQLDGPKLAYGTSLASTPKKTSGVPNQQDRLAALNRENRRKNAEEVRQAQIKERRAAKATEAALARGEDVTEDHSRRLKTRAKFKHDVSESKANDSERSGTNTPAVGTPNLAAKKTSGTLPHLGKLQVANGDKKGIPTMRRPLMDDDIIGAIDLGIDLDLEI